MTDPYITTSPVFQKVLQHTTDTTDESRHTINDLLKTKSSLHSIQTSIFISTLSQT